MTPALRVKNTFIDDTPPSQSLRRFQTDPPPGGLMCVEEEDEDDATGVSELCDSAHRRQFAQDGPMVCVKDTLLGCAHPPPPAPTVTMPLARVSKEEREEELDDAVGVLENAGTIEVEERPDRPAGVSARAAVGGPVGAPCVPCVPQTWAPEFHRCQRPCHYQARGKCKDGDKCGYCHNPVHAANWKKHKNSRKARRQPEGI